MNKRSVIVRTVIVLCCIIIFSCRKDFKNIFEQQNQIPSTILEEAKIWHAKNATLTQGIVSSLNSKAAPIKTRFIRLEPLWAESWTVPSYPGNKLLIVPTRENKITNPLLKIRRVFIFPIINNKVAGGEIIDIIGFNFDVSANLDYILSNYTSDKINNFNGAIIRYDLNYYFLNSAKYNQGIKTNEKVRINKVPVADTQIKTSKTLSAKGLGTGKSVSSFGSSSDGTGSGGGLGPCTAVYYYFYQLDSEGYKIFEEWTFLYYEGNCSGQDTSNPGTGTNTNYTGTGPGGGGGGGYGGNTPPAQDNTLISALMNDPNSLTTDQKTQLQTILNNILKDCIGRSTYNYLTSNGHKFDFLINSGAKPPASYNPSNQSIAIKDPSSLDATSLQEEFFHAYQNYTMPGGTTQYLGKSGSANIEFEAKVLRDMNTMVNGQGGILAITGDNYRNFLIDVTNGFSAFPSSFTPSQLTQYFNYMNDFIQPSQNPGYSNDIIKGDLNPTSMFNLINNSPC